jgi:chromosome segregation ATPase
MRTKSQQRKSSRRNNLSEYDYINVSKKRKPLSRNYDNYVSNRHNEINPLYFLFGDDNEEIEKLKQKIKLLESKKDEECNKKLEECNKNLAECKTNLALINEQMEKKISELKTKIAENDKKNNDILKLTNDITTLKSNHDKEIQRLNKDSELQRKNIIRDYTAQINSLTNQKGMLEEQIEKYKNTINELEHVIENLTNEIEKLKKDLEQKEENLQKLQEEIDVINKERKQNNIKKKAIIKEKETEIESLKKEKEKQIDELKESIKLRQNIKKILDAVIINSAKKEKELNEQISKITKQIEEKTKLENNRVKENLNLTEQNEKLISELNELTNQINNVFINEKLKFTNPDTKTVDSVTPNYKYVNKAIEQLGTELNSRKDDIQEKHVLWTEAIKDNEKLKKTHTQELTEILNQLTQAQNVNVEYKNKCDEESEEMKKTHTDEIEKLKEEHNKNCDLKIKQNTDLLNAKHKLDMDNLHLSLESDCTRTQNVLKNQHQTEIKNLNESIDTLTKENKQFKIDISRLNAENATLTTNIDARQTRIVEFENQMREIRDVMKTVSSTLSSNEEKIGKMPNGDGKKYSRKRKYKRKSGKRRNKKM